MDAVLQYRNTTIYGVPVPVILLTLFISACGAVITFLLGFPLWVDGFAVVIPILPLVFRQVAWSSKHYGWLALYYFLAVVQTAHAGEHMAIMWQVHVLKWPILQSHGIFGTLDTEWVHFLFNTWACILVLFLITRFRQNPWLKVAGVICTWHTFEHFYIMHTYLTTGVSGTPGLISQGGAIHGGLPFSRADVHAAFNVAETIPMLLGFFYEVQRRYDTALSKAFPALSARQLVAIDRQATMESFAIGTTILREGEPTNLVYIVSRGEIVVTHSDPDGNNIEVATLGPGHIFGGICANEVSVRTFTAGSTLEVLALEGEVFREFVEHASVETPSLDRVLQPAAVSAYR